MAEVFLGRRVGAMGFQRLVALKLIRTNFTRDPEFVTMFIDEARIAMHLNHRNIVQVLDLEQEQDIYYLTMEFVHGANLYNLYERLASANQWFEVPLAMYIVAQVCKGLHFAHTRTGPNGQPLNIIHRDISPQNILLSFAGEVKITDFGIATAAERLHQTAAGIVKGKYAYMAPERLDERTVDARVDVFSAGVLLYELLVGENPFAGANTVETIEAVLKGDVTRPSDKGAPVPKQLDDLCMKAIAPRPEDRFPSALALSEALTSFAMNLTYTRSDMASGDVALAELLGQLFPLEKSRSFESDGNKVHLPGLSTIPPPGADVPYAHEPTLLRAPVPVEQQVHQSNAVTDDVDDSDETGPAESLADDATLEGDATIPLTAEAVEKAVAAQVQSARNPRTPSNATTSSGQSRTYSPSPPMKRGFPMVGMLVMALLVGFGLYFGYQMNVEQTASVEVMVYIESEPQGALVRVNGERQTGLTPTTLELIAGQTYKLALSLDGYREAQQTIMVSYEPKESFRIKLRPKTGAN